MFAARSKGLLLHNAHLSASMSRLRPRQQCRNLLTSTSRILLQSFKAPSSVMGFRLSGDAATTATATATSSSVQKTAINNMSSTTSTTLSHDTTTASSILRQIAAAVVGSSLVAAAAATVVSSEKQERVTDCDSSLLEVERFYDVDNEALGEGGCGQVHKAKRKSDGTVVALKVIDREWTNNKEFEAEIQALDILSNPGHRHVCRMFGKHSDDPNFYYLAMELIEGGELFEHLMQNGPFSEKDAARFLQQHASAVSYIHSKGLIHADLKPENLMMSSWDATTAELKVIDFGSAVPFFCNKNNKKNHESQQIHQDLQSLLHPQDLDDNCVRGTPGYIPPELYARNNGGLTPAADMFATGVIMYILLTGTHPFDPTGMASEEDLEAAVRSSRNKGYLQKHVFGERTEYLSPSCVDLMEKLLHPNPNLRMTSDEFYAHPWIQGSTASATLLEDSDQKLQRFWQKRFRMAVLQKYGNDATKQLSEANLKQIFHSMDVDGSGTVDARELKLAIGELVTDKNVQDVIKSIDFDRNGTIDMEEFIRVMRMHFEDGSGVDVYDSARFKSAIFKKFVVPGEINDGSLRKIFNAIDLNGDGQLSVSELQELIKSLPGIDEEQLMDWIDTIDTDFSGVVDFEEFAVAMKKSSA